MIARRNLQSQISAAVKRSRVVMLAGPRQCGKTTLARELLNEESANYFDLEDPAALSRLDEPMTALSPLRGLVVIDEVQRHPGLFPILRVLADRRGTLARFLILGSASGELMRQSSESLAGRMERIDLILRRGDQLLGVECKRADAPGMTPSIRIALDDLKLERVAVIYPGAQRYPLTEQVEAVPLAHVAMGDPIFA